jgi:molybdopterin/thiamine biosynthesis adenylyltransferase
MQSRATLTPKNIIIVGLGGIGSWLAEPLMRYCSFSLREKPKFFLVDGDHYSLSNLTRQSLHPRLTGMNKASATALRLRQYFPALVINEVPEFISSINIKEILNVGPGTYIFNCCDNNYCRKIISNYVLRYKPESVILSGGNEITDGNSHVYDRNNYCVEITKSHPEVDLALASEDRGAMSCQQIAEMPSSSQIIVTNFWAAAIMLQQFYLMTNNQCVQETFFDIRKSAINAVEPIR